jgi:hypothetical protein
MCGWVSAATAPAGPQTVSEKTKKTIKTGTTADADTRVYTVTYVATGSSGNSSGPVSATVTVPR